MSTSRWRDEANQQHNNEASAGRVPGCWFTPRPVAAYRYEICRKRLKPPKSVLTAVCVDETVLNIFRSIVAGYRLLYLQNKSLSMVGNFQGVDGVADVLTESRLTLISLISVKTCSSYSKKKRFQGRKRELLRINQRNQKLTLFFSNFQFSSWVRICSTTDMASRPCLTYSFSWK